MPGETFFATWPLGPTGLCVFAELATRRGGASKIAYWSLEGFLPNRAESVPDLESGALIKNPHY